MFDVIIIGAGPAGATASLYTQRGNLKTLMIHNDESNLLKAKTIENYYGFENGITGNELYEQGIKQASNLGVTVIKEETLKIEVKGDYFEVITTQNKYEGKTVILATGTKKKATNIKGIKEFEGKGVSYCATCDAFFFRGKDVGVLGNKEYALHEAQTLLPIAKSVTIFTNGEEPIEKRAEGLKIEEKKIREFRGIEKIEEIEFEDTTKNKIDGVFIAIGTASSSDLARKLGVKLEKKTNNIDVNDKMETNMPGLYACGDCVGGILQIAKAVYEGMVAGMSVIKYLKNN